MGKRKDEPGEGERGGEGWEAGTGRGREEGNGLEGGRMRGGEGGKEKRMDVERRGKGSPLRSIDGNNCATTKTILTFPHSKSILA